MSEFFFSAFLFGLIAGIQPGPLGVFVIQQTLSRGLPAGVRASLAPLITDGPIIIAALWILPQFKSIDLLAAAMSLFGGVYLLLLAAKMFQTRDTAMSEKLQSQGSLAMAVKLNVLNPGPYLFWLTVGGSYIIRGTALECAIFVVTAIVMLIASKIAMALLASRFVAAPDSRGYVRTMKFLAVLMVVFGLLSIQKAAQLLMSSGHGF